MNQAAFLTRLEELYSDNVEISRRKNSDYASDKDPFQNFRLIETLSGGRIHAEEGILVRMCDKMQRISNLMDGREAQVKDESLLDALSDLANYAMILRMYLET